MGGKLGTPWDRFQTKYRVNKKTGCWEWTASLNERGYGIFYFPPQNMIAAYRASWRLHCGEPGELHVLHSCDNRKCVNPHHLWLGTHQQNIQDRQTKGRMADKAGEKNGRAKASTALVRKIRKDRRSTKLIVQEFPHLTYAIVQNIRRMATWKHIK